MRKRRRDDEEITIVRRGNGRREQEEAAGGAWKVAFADFTLAMMALFMVLWVTQPQRDAEAAAAAEEKADTVFDGGAGVFDGSSTLSVVELEVVSTPVDAEVAAEFPAGLLDSQRELRALAELVRRLAEEADAVANLEAHVVPQGLRILIKDDEARFMFARGSAELVPHFEALLRRLAGVLAKVENRLIISGHTDSTPYPGGARYDNWNLSGDRALRARSVLVEAGLPAEAVLQVTAQAAVMPVLPEDPTHGANRRVEILVLTGSAEALYQELFGDSYAQVHLSEDRAELRGVD